MFWTPDISLEAGPYKVLLKKGEFVDSSREGRVVPYKIYYPAEHDLAKVPVVVWSHGFGGNRDGAAFLSRYLASYGYALAHLTHIGTDSSIWEGKDGHPWDILRQTQVDRPTTLNRFYDVPFFIDELQRWAGENPEVGVFDFDAIGMSGHSFGALTTQVMAGQQIPNEDETLIRIHEPRFKAGILYSPVPIGHMLEGHGASADSIYGPIAMPLLHMTGTEDASPIGGAPYDHRLVVFEETGHDEKYLLVKQGGDHMVYNGTRGKLKENPLREKHEEIIRLASLAFWEAQLKGDVVAQDWLAGAAQNWLRAEASFKSGA